MYRWLVSTGLCTVIGVLIMSIDPPTDINLTETQTAGINLPAPAPPITLLEE